MDLKNIQSLLDDAIKQEVFSAISIKVSGAKNFEFSTGYLDLSKQELVSSKTLFDIASITKSIIATIFFKLHHQKKISVYMPLGDFYKLNNINDVDSELSKKTIYDLLTHSSGLKAWMPLYKELIGKKTFYEYIRTKYPRGKAIPEYSDLGYILLGEILELYYSMPLNLVVENFLRDLGINDITYLPLHNAHFEKYDIVSSGHSLLRTAIPMGVVNDDNCFKMGGVSGHAGLFATVNGLAEFSLRILDIYNNNSDICDKRTFLDLLKVRDEKTGWSAGWVYPTSGGQAGTLLSKNSIGSLGFTGTSLWIDLDKQFTIVILANRTVSEKSITSSSSNDEFTKLRPRLMDMILSI